MIKDKVEDRIDRDYRIKKMTIENMLQELGVLVEKHDVKSGTAKHWSHVGDLGKVAGDLEDIINFIIIPIEPSANDFE